MDDCSPDRSIEILENVLERYPNRKEQTIIVRLNKNGGLGNARKVSFEKATGDYVSFVDSDDFVSVRMIELLVNKARETGADVIDGAFAYYANEQPGPEVQPSKDSQSVYLKKILLQHVVTHQIWARLISRSFLVDQQLFYQSGINMGEDYSMVPRILLKARWTTIEDLIYFYRIDRLGTFTNANSRHHVVSTLKANAMVANYFSQHDTQNEYRTPLQSVALPHPIGASRSFLRVTAMRQCGCRHVPLSEWSRALVLMDQAAGVAGSQHEGRLDAFLQEPV